METFAEILPHAFEHAFIDTLKLVPFLFVTYLAMEALEHYASSKSVVAVRRAGTAGPVIGALLGVVPQCGFSAAAATLYSARVITLGTLFAVFLSTSDEMLPIMIAAQAPAGFIAEVLAIKALCGLIAGFAIDVVLRLRHHAVEAMRIRDLCERDHCGCEDESDASSALFDACQKHEESAANRIDDWGAEHSNEEERGAELACASDERHERDRAHDHDRGHEHSRDHVHAHNRSHGHAHGFGAIAKSSLVHTLQVTLFVFLVSLALSLALSAVVQARNGGIQLDTMFIDEGFGTLDEHSIADALAVLQIMSSSRGYVGIISHVELLKENIPAGILVEKSREGSHVQIRKV